MCATHGEFILKFSHGSIIYIDIFGFVIITRLNHGWRTYKSVRDFVPEVLKNWTFFTTATTTHYYYYIYTHFNSSVIPSFEQGEHQQQQQKEEEEKKEEEEEKGPVITCMSLSYQDNVRGSTA